MLLIIIKQDEVITITFVSTNFQLMQNVVIKFGEVKVTEPLRQVIPNRTVFATRERENHIINNSHEFIIFDNFVKHI